MNRNSSIGAKCALMARIDLVSKNLLANCIRNQKSIEEMTNVAKIAKGRRIFLAM